MSGDEPEELPLQRELPALRRFLRRLVGRGRSEEAEDLAQDTLERALRYRHAFERGRPPGPWLRRTALRAFLDRREASARDPLAGAEREVEHPVSPPDELERRDYVEHLLARLEPVEREALVRFHARGQSVREVARAMELPEGTVKSHLHRARRRLARVALEERGGGA
jgi:RNA polymerase sigma-70 factor (ECF subfamily)